MRMIRSGLLTSAVLTAAAGALMIPAAAQQPKPASAASIDVLGVRLGMTAAEAAKVARSANSSYQLTTGQPFRFDVLPNVGFNEIATLRAPQSPDGKVGQDGLDIRLTQPPNTPLVYHVARNKQFGEPERPTVANLIAGLREKYGREDVVNPSPTEPGVEWRMAFWIYDANGQHLPKAQAQQVVTGCSQMWETQYLQQLQVPANRNGFRAGNGTDCGNHIAVRVTLFPSNQFTGAPGLATQFNVMAVHMALYKDHLTKSLALLEQAEQQQLNQQQQKANQVKPKL